MKNSNNESLASSISTNEHHTVAKVEKKRTARKSCEHLPEPAYGRREERRIRFEHWLQNGSDRLDDAWVSISPHARSNEVEPMLLTEIVQAIRTGGPIAVTTEWGPKYIYFKANQAKVRKLYQLGREEAHMLNQSSKQRILAEKGLKADPRKVGGRFRQPKRNVNFFYYRSLHVDMVRRNLPGKFVYHCPDALGEARAEEAKKWTPGVTFAGLCLGLHNMKYVVRYTGLFPINVDVDVEQAIKHPCVRLVFSSITGNDLCVCALGPVARDPEEYKKLYKKISAKLCRDLDAESKVDEATLDPARLTFLPHDGNVFFQP